MKLYIITVSSCTNNMLKWPVGSFVRECHNGYGGKSFERSYTPSVYLTEDAAKDEIRDRANHFSGVTFKVNTFTQEKVKAS